MKVEQPTLPRAVCAARSSGHTCTLLMGHTGPHLSGPGKSWYEVKK